MAWGARDASVRRRAEVYRRWRRCWGFAQSGTRTRALGCLDQAQTTYLQPDGSRFDQLSSARGNATATQVAYWLSLIPVATRRRDTLYPAFLLIDSPQLALNTAEDIAEQMYCRFVTQVTVLPGRIQFIVADNELPTTYGREFAELTNSYDRPTISTVEHPGPATVELLVDPDLGT